MKLSRYISRSLMHFRRTNLAVIGGVAIAVAVLSGALTVGNSVRDSLRSLLAQRLGAVEYIVSADRFFRQNLAAAFTSAADGNNSFASCPIIYLQGVAIHEAKGARAFNVNIYGVDERFWEFQALRNQRPPQGREALVGDLLARDLGISTGDAMLLSVETQQGIPRESLFGRRGNVGRQMRLTCREILPAEGLGEFALRPSQGTVHSIFVPLSRLQSDLGQPSRANVILLAATAPGAGLQAIRDALKSGFAAEDAGVKLRLLPSGNGIAVESTRTILDTPVAQAAFQAAADEGMKASGVFTYLANTIRAGGREIPYSVITAADLGRGALTAVREVEGLPQPPSPPEAKEAIWLNEWAWRDLGISPGEAVEVDYFFWLEEGRLTTRTARFRLAGVVSIGGDVDATLAPEFPGITETRSMSAWDPPFPLDLRRIRKKDEDYWDLHKATPKAFITLERGQELWQNRFGKLTAVRLERNPERQSSSPSLAGAASKTALLGGDLEGLSRDLRSRLNPEQVGFALTAVRERGLDASRGSTDFGEYFVYFSFFLIASALMLAALFFRLGIEQRVAEIGTLQALGFPLATLRRIFLSEGALLSLAGSLLGLLGAIGYGWLMMFGLRTWWVDAVGTNRLYLHVSWADLAAGAGAGILASVATIALTLRGLQRNSPRALLGGVLESTVVRGRRARRLGIISSSALLAALLLLLGSAWGKIADLPGFFGAGFLLLVSSLSLIALFLRRQHPAPISGHGWRALFRLGARNAGYRPGRSILCAALIASATFIIVSMEAFRQDSRSLSLEPRSGTGGYPLIAESAFPILEDPNSDAGREALGIPAAEFPDLANVGFVPFRMQPGDDVSCLNLYAPQEPRILGAPAAFLASRRFSFTNSLASTPEEERNPWLLLESGPRQGVIPAIGDANTLQYVLHLDVGSELTVRGGKGEPVRLRLVAALRNSIFQGELLISEADFLRAFPDREGYRAFLLDVPEDRAAAVVQPLEERLADWGFNVESSRERLAAYHQVENTYLSTFQSLGALGLILGTAGLATVLLRNVLERRRELALMRAVGYRRGTLAAIIVAENVMLMSYGLAGGTACALLAILPAVHSRGAPFPAAMVGLILVAVLMVGLASSLLAVAAALRAPLLEALKSE